MGTRARRRLGAVLVGVHLLVPGHGDDGPTLEAFTYGKTVDQKPGPANRRGLAPIAFEVNDVPAVAERVLKHGGSLCGEIAEHHVEGVGALTFVYARDPEGNLVELKIWRKGDA